MKESTTNIKNKYLRISSSNELQSIMNEICHDYCNTLDSYMTEIDNTLASTTVTSINTNTIEEWILNLTSVLYFTISGLEVVGLKEDMCKSIRQELYAKAHETTSGTVAERQNHALLVVQDEDTVLQIYSRAYKRIKQKVDAGYEMQSALKKIMSARITDSELSNSRYNGKERD